MPLIVLIDDDRDFLEMNRGILEAQGFRISCFTDADQAWQSMKAEAPDLVITDLMMRSLDSGFSLARKIKSDPGLGDLPVIIVTAVASRRGFDFNPGSRAELEAMGADAYFDKPVAPQLLVAKVKELLP
ncbi:MAG: response regulator transcription factor [Spirochaetaceae bacterium]|nr:MAG: response regulator transcription factor [Spirochaetaceae bacterium]